MTTALPTQGWTPERTVTKDPRARRRATADWCLTCWGARVIWEACAGVLVPTRCPECFGTGRARA